MMLDQAKVEFWFALLVYSQSVILSDLFVKIILNLGKGILLPDLFCAMLWATIKSFCLCSTNEVALSLMFVAHEGFALI